MLLAARFVEGTLQVVAVATCSQDKVLRRLKAEVGDVLFGFLWFVLRVGCGASVGQEIHFHQGFSGLSAYPPVWKATGLTQGRRPWFSPVTHRSCVA